MNNPPEIDEEDGVIVIDVDEGMTKEDVLNLIMATVEKWSCLLLWLGDAFMPLLKKKGSLRKMCLSMIDCHNE